MKHPYRTVEVDDVGIDASADVSDLVGFPGQRGKDFDLLDVAGHKVQVGFAHRNTHVDVHVGDREFQIYDSRGELLATITKTTTRDVSRYKAYGWGDNIG